MWKKITIWLDLQLLKPLVFDTHQLVFAGGTALAKSGVALNRMSEDVDIKLVPKDAFGTFRTQRKNTRKEIVQAVSSAIASWVCSILMMITQK